jgi:hypothetical protein
LAVPAQIERNGAARGAHVRELMLPVLGVARERVQEQSWSISNASVVDVDATRAGLNPHFSLTALFWRSIEGIGQSGFFK